MFVPRILNLAKVKDSLIQGAGAPGQAVGTRPRVSRWRVWSADMHIGPIADLKQVVQDRPARPAPRILLLSGVFGTPAR
jgi:hypothetical protein